MSVTQKTANYWQNQAASGDGGCTRVRSATQLGSYPAQNNTNTHVGNFQGSGGPWKVSHPLFSIQPPPLQPQAGAPSPRGALHLTSAVCPGS